MGANQVFKYFPDLTDRQKNQLRQLHPLYLDWNSQINVVSRKDIDQLYLRHVLHSLSIARFIRFTAGSSVLDIGTGGGFPGIPLAILFPESNFHLVDSIGKKIKVVEEIAKSIGLKNLTAQHERAEKVKGKFDFIVSRAVARTKVLYQWTHQKIKTENINKIGNGLIFLKGGDLEEEMKELNRPFSETGITIFFEEDFFNTKNITYIPV